jgi:hypothetical protein
LFTLFTQTPKTLDITGFVGINSVVNILFTDGLKKALFKTFQKNYKKVLTNGDG